MDITTQTDLIFVECRVFKNKSAFFWLQAYIDYLSIGFKKPHILDKVILLYLVRIIRCSDLDKYFISLFSVKRDMARFLFTYISLRGQLLDIHGSFYKTFFILATMGTNKDSLDIFKRSSWFNSFFSYEGIIDIGARGTGEFLHRISGDKGDLFGTKIDFLYFFL